MSRSFFGDLEISKFKAVKKNYWFFGFQCEFEQKSVYYSFIKIICWRFFFILNDFFGRAHLNVGQ